MSVAGESIYNPFGDGDPENDDDVARTVDGDTGTAWSTVTYRGSAAFGNLKPGVGIVYDLGSEQSLAGVTVSTGTPGATVEVRTGATPAADLAGFPVAGTATLTGDGRRHLEDRRDLFRRRLAPVLLHDQVRRGLGNTEE